MLFKNFSLSIFFIIISLIIYFALPHLCLFHLYSTNTTFNSLMNKEKNKGKETMGCPILVFPSLFSFSALMIS